MIVFLDPVIAVRLSFNTDDPYLTLFKQGIQIIVDGGQHHFISSFLKNPEDIFRWKMFTGFIDNLQYALSVFSHKLI